MNQIEKAVAVLTSLGSDDSLAIERYVSPRTYIQHNLAIASGRKNFFDALPKFKAMKRRIQTLRAFEDGPYCVTHNLYSEKRNIVGFDIFRFENGMIVEHWDNQQQQNGLNASGRSMTDGPTGLADFEKTEGNKVIVDEFVHKALIERQWKNAQSFFADQYFQHNPQLADDWLNFKEASLELQLFEISKVHMILGCGNFTLAVMEGRRESRPAAFYLLFRLENGKLTEQWDTVSTFSLHRKPRIGPGKF